MNVIVPSINNKIDFYATCNDCGHGEKFKNSGGKSCGTGPCILCNKRNALPIHLLIDMKISTAKNVCKECKIRLNYQRIVDLDVALKFGLHGIIMGI